VLLSVHVALSWCVGLVALLQNLALALGLCGFANVPPNALAFKFFAFVVIQFY
jgi:hypothetical protein